MTDPVNLDNLREMIGGDPDIEQELFAVFINSSNECINNLRNSLDDENDKIWRQQAHAWKGMCLNLGAESLSKLCAEAQIHEGWDKNKKEQMLNVMIEEYANVKNFLTTP